MYNLRKVQLIERGIWANAPFKPAGRSTRGMQMLVIYGALAMTAYAAGGYWLLCWLSQ